MEETKSLVAERTSLQELMAGLSKAQRMYLSLSLRGMSHAEALAVVEVKSKTVVEWGEGFRKVAGYVLSHADREIYQKEALEIFASNLSVKAQELIDTLLDKGIHKWEEIDRYDKSCVMQAIGLVAKRGMGGKGEGGGSYEELILRKHIAQ